MKKKAKYIKDTKRDFAFRARNDALLYRIETEMVDAIYKVIDKYRIQK